MDKLIKQILDSGTIIPEMNIVVGLSGGPDSLTLFHALMQLKQDMSLGVIPVHVNHKLRDNADAEQAHVEEICRSLGTECNSYEIDCKALAEESKLSIEEAGRVARYSIFSEVADAAIEQGADPRSVVIAVAHNADDQSETVLFRIIRGTGIHGLSGIRPVRYEDEERMIIRPLLSIPRSEIEAYIERNGLVPNHDESNDETDATRNRIRLELIPYIEENFNPNVKDALRRLAESAAIDDDYLDQIAYSVYMNIAEEDTADDSITIHTEMMAEHHVSIIRRVIGLVLKDYGLEQETSLALIGGIMEVMFSGNPSARMDLPGGLVCEREYDRLVFRVLSAYEDQDESEIKSNMRLVPMVIDASEYDPDTPRIHAAFDAEKFMEAYPDQLGKVKIRNRDEGDYIAIAGGKRKKLQDYFVDAKVPRAERNRLPVVAIGSEVLWIPPNDALPTASEREKGRFSQNYQIDDKTGEVLFLEIVKSI